jgi:hypothetical protein
MTARHVSPLKTVSSVLFLVLALALGLLLASTPAYAEAPANDDFYGATWVGSLPFTDYVFTGDATAGTAPADPSCGGTNATVWYAITPWHDMTLQAAMSVGYTPTDYETSFSVHTWDGMSFSEVACFPTTWAQPLTVDLRQGVDYHIMISTWGEGGNLYLTLEEVPPPPPPPDNDDIYNARVIYDVSYWDWVDITSATSVDDPFYCFSPSATVWYTFSPSRDMLVEASTWGSGYEAAIAVFSGAPGALNDVACGYWSVSFDAYAGQTYYFMVGNTEWSSPGYLNFYVHEMLPPLSVELAINPQGTFSSITGAATVYGTVTCSRPATVELSGQVSQFVGRLNTLRGYFYAYFDCDGTTAWSASATPENGRFAGGHAQVSVSAWAYDWQTGESVWTQVSDSVTLSRAPK